MRWTKSRFLGVYLATTFAGAWGATAFVAQTAQDFRGPEGLAASVFMAFWPGFVAISMQAMILPGAVFPALGFGGKPNAAWLFAALAGPILLLLGLGFAAMLGADLLLTREALLAARAGSEAASAPGFGDDMVHPLVSLVYALPAAPILGLLMIGQEVGLRGFLFREMPGGFWARSAGIGLVWANLFAPAFALGLVDETGGLQAALVGAAGLMALSPVLVYLRARSGNVLATALFVGSVMACRRPGASLTAGADDWLRPPFGVAGVLAIVVLLGLCYAHDRWFAEHRLMASPTPTPDDAPAGTGGDAPDAD